MQTSNQTVAAGPLPDLALKPALAPQPALAPKPALAPQPITRHTSALPLPRVLTGNRVVVRQYVDADAMALFEGVDESRVALKHWMPWVDSVRSVDDRLDYIRKCQAQFLAPHADLVYGMFDVSGHYLGGTGLHRINWNTPSFEIGYWLRLSAHGQGYVTQAIGLLTTACFETLGAARVEIKCDAANQKSANVPKRLGFNQEATLRCERRNTAGALSDSLVFALTWDDWRERLQVV